MISVRASAGRVVKLGADVGDTIERGAVLVELESPQLVAALGAARAALAVAKADLDRINSTRPETIAARKAEVAAAEADVTLYQENYTRQASSPARATRPRRDSTKRPTIWRPRIRKREAAEAALQLADHRREPGGARARGGARSSRPRPR